MTLKDIAKEAGVSISTVSRVLNHSSPNAASKEVQDRIWEIVRRTGYTPNFSARNLQQQKSEQSIQTPRSIACMYARTPENTADLFFSSLVRSIEQEAFKHKYILKYSFTSLNIHDPVTFRLINEYQVNGLVILGRCDKQLLTLLRQHFPNIVSTGLNKLEGKFDQVGCNGEEVSKTALEYLIKLGHSAIAYIGETQSEERYTGYQHTLAQNGLPLRPELVVNVPMTPEGGYRGAQRLLSSNATFSAIFCGNDTTAIGAMRAISEAGKKIPEDISVISIDNIDTAQYLTPMLTTIHIPTEEMGQMAAKLLIDRIEGGHSLPMKLSLPHHLVCRESCCKYTGPR